MYVDIPTVNREMKDGECRVSRGTLRVQVDTSLYAHLKWERHFQDSLQCDLAGYVSRISSLPGGAEKAGLLSALKVLYCFIDSPELPTFTDFVKLFDLSMAAEILDVLTKVLEEVHRTSSKNC